MSDAQAVQRSNVQMGPAEPIVSNHFVTREQQNEASFIGMWLFLAQEVMFFGGLFTAYAFYRYRFPEAWAEGASHLNIWFGGINTVVLLMSSLTMAMTVYSTQVGKWRDQVLYFCATIGLGLVFLGIKAIEYTEKWNHGLIPGIHWQPHEVLLPETKLYMSLYFIMSGMHALHMIIGFAIGAVFIYLCIRKEYGPHKYLPVEFFGFYWHFVDIVWVFLFPLLYLIG